MELVAIPEEGYEFCAWTLPNGTEVSTNAILQMTATDSLECVAHFVALAPDIESVESSQSGVLLRWRNVAWATRYHVWRGTSPDLSQAGKIATLANDGTAEYSDASVVEDGDYWYWIEAEGMDEDLFGGAARGWRGKERFAITYENLRGATHSNPASFTVDDAFSFTPPSPRVGYTFTGWTPSDVVAGTASELVVWANWHQNEYAVHFDANGGTGSMEDEAFTYGLWKYLTSNTFARVGHAFAGWSDVAMASSPSYSDGESVKNLTAEPNGSVTLYAMWTAESYTITLDRQGGSGGTASVTATYGGAMPSVSVPTRTGYTFGGYHTAANGGGTQYYTATGISARNWDKDTDTTLYAKWTAKTFKITLNKQSGAGGTASVTATYDSAMPSVTVPTRTGYTFGGYYTAANGGGTQYYTVSGASARRWDKTTATTLYAKWTGNTYAVTLDWQGGSGGVASASATYGSAMPTITVPTRTGYTFGGYYTAANGAGTQYYTASGTSARSWDKTAATILYAKWTAKTYMVTLDRQGGSGGTASVTATYGSAMPAITVPTKTNLRFKGYFTGANGTGTQYYTASGASARSWDRTSATTLYACWRENQAPAFTTVTPNVDFIGMEIGATETFTVAASDADGDSLTTTWYLCDKATGADNRVGSGSSFAFTPTRSGDYRVKAEVSDGRATISTLWDVKVFPADVADYGELAGSDLVWFVAGTTLTICGNGPMPSYANVDPPYQGYADMVTRIVVEEGVTEIGDNAFQDFQNVMTVSLPETLTAIGTGAFAECRSLMTMTIPDHVTSIGNGIFDGCINLKTLHLPVHLIGKTADMAIPAGCAVVSTYTIRFNANGGSGSMAAQTVDGNDSVELTANHFIRPGFVFLGWSATTTGPVDYADKASVKNLAAAGGSVTLYAQWAVEKYKVTYNKNGGKLPKGKKMAAQKMTYGKAAKLRKNVFTRKGYVFAGWAKSKANAKKGMIAYRNAQSVKNLRTDGGTTTLYAVWAKKTYKVAFYANGGKGEMVAQTMTYGKAKKLSANKFNAPKGKKFAGWATSKANAKKGIIKYKNKKAVKNLVTTGKTVKLYAVWKKK